MATESIVLDILGDDLQGERVVYAVVASTRRWYSYLPWGAGGPGRHSWYLAITPTRVFILSAQRRAEDWRGMRNVQANKSDVAVQSFRRTGLMSWTLRLDVRTEGHWGLHGLTGYQASAPTRPRRGRSQRRWAGIEAGPLNSGRTSLRRAWHRTAIPNSGPSRCHRAASICSRSSAASARR